MMYRNYRHKSNKSKNLILKFSYIFGFILVLFLFIWKMPVKQIQIIKNIEIQNSVLR